MLIYMLKPRLEIHFSLREQWQFLFGKPYLAEADEYLLNHARSGIMLALQSLRLPEGSKVGMMLPNCHTVMNAISQAGCVPVFIDINENLTISMTDLQRKATELQALVVTHLFGIESDIQTIKEQYPELPIIEDCAHAYGKQILQGDFVVFSIGQGKLPSVGDGGILRVVNPAYKAEIEHLCSSLPTYSRTQSVRLFCRLLLKSWLYNPFIYKYFTLPYKQQRGAISVKEQLVLLQMNSGVSALYNEKKKSVNDMIKTRLHVAAKLQHLLSTDANVSGTLLGDNAFMLVAVCDDSEKLLKSLQQKGIDSATHFAQSISWAKQFGYKENTCPIAEQILPHLLMIPTYK